MLVGNWRLPPLFIGHSFQWNILKKMAENDRVPHALLFSGQEKIGKKKVAFEYVKLLNCESKEIAVRPCNVCLACKLVASKKHPDIFFLEQGKEEIKIDQIRDLQKWLILKPQLANRKMVILDEAHLLNVEAANCFLKTLEEPTGQSIFILITSHPDVLLPTIRSRVSNIKFFPVAKSEMIKIFSDSDNSILRDKILTISLGRPGAALNFLQNSDKLDDFLLWQTIVKQIIDGELFDRLAIVKKFFDKNKEFSSTAFLRHFLIFCRERLLYKIGVVNVGQNGQKDDMLSKSSVESIKQMLERGQETLSIINTTNVSPRLAIENLLINI